MLASPCNVGQGPTLAGMEGAKGSEVAGSNGGSAIVELGRSGGPPGRLPQTAKPGDKLWQWTWDNITKLSPVFDRPQFAHGFTGGAVCLAAPKMPQGVPPPAWSTVGVIDV